MFALSLLPALLASSPPLTTFAPCVCRYTRSPAFGELSDTHFFRPLVGSREDRKAMWGEAPIVPEEICETFASYIEGKIPKLVRKRTKCRFVLPPRVRL